MKLTVIMLLYILGENTNNAARLAGLYGIEELEMYLPLSATTTILLFSKAPKQQTT